MSLYIRRLVLYYLLLFDTRLLRKLIFDALKLLFFITLQALIKKDKIQLQVSNTAMLQRGCCRRFATSSPTRLCIESIFV